MGRAQIRPATRSAHVEMKMFMKGRATPSARQIPAAPADWSDLSVHLKPG